MVDDPNAGEGLRRYAPACERNRSDILAHLKSILHQIVSIKEADDNKIYHLLEIASGTGEHAVFCAPHLNNWLWQPSDIHPDNLSSINAHRAHLYQSSDQFQNILPAIELNTLDQAWRTEVSDQLPVDLDAIFIANMTHISPFSATEGLMEGASKRLSDQGMLIIYGPFFKDDFPLSDGKPDAPSNCNFDVWLMQNNSEWGVRSMVLMAETASRYQLTLTTVHSLPANNFILLLQLSSNIAK